ncbi:MAG: 30S ribosomal protein S15 [Thaumarchaeota archaeon]|nr:30S ribosomal protein S15 [Nitrososphaerota archaeon]
MARMYSRSRGKSHSMRPTFKRAPSWITYSPDEVEALIVNLAKDEVPPSVIGIKLRDEYGIPLVKPVLGKPMQDVLKAHNLAKEIPEDLGLLVKRAQKLHAHLKEHHGDRKNVHSLELIEAKIHRLTKRYKRLGLMAQHWKYASKIAKFT